MPSTWDRLRPPTDGNVARGLLMIGHIILDGRREAGLTQRQLGALSGLNQSTISRLERGKLPGLSMKNLATIIGVLSDRRRASRWHRAA